MEVEDTKTTATPERRGIMDLLEGGDVLTVSDIADALGKTEVSVRSSLSRMVKDGQVERVSRGKYQRIVEDTSIIF